MQTMKSQTGVNSCFLHHFLNRKHERMDNPVKYTRNYEGENGTESWKRRRMKEKEENEGKGRG